MRAQVLFDALNHTRVTEVMNERGLKFFVKQADHPNEHLSETNFFVQTLTQISKYFEIKEQ